MNSVPSDTLVFNSAEILRWRCLHGASKLLGRFIDGDISKSLEFECRYRRYLAEFGEADSDVVVSTFSKSGTTWMQLILYQLTTCGDMSFDHLFDVSPWVWYAAVRQTQPALTPAPRLLKSHDDYRRFKNGKRGRFIFVTRDGRDVCVSLFHHRKNFKRFEGSFKQHFYDFLYGAEYNWFEHTKRWFENSYGLPIHYVRYEDLKSDFETTVRGVADYLGLQIDDAIIARTVDRCSFSAMKRHESQLGPRNDHFANTAEAPYFVKNPDQFIRRGQIGDGLATLSAEQLEDYRDRFDRSLADFPPLAAYR